MEAEAKQRSELQLYLERSVVFGERGKGESPNGWGFCVAGLPTRDMLRLSRLKTLFSISAGDFGGPEPIIDGHAIFADQICRSTMQAYLGGNPRFQIVLNWHSEEINKKAERVRVDAAAQLLADLKIEWQSGFECVPFLGSARIPTLKPFTKMWFVQPVHGLEPAAALSVPLLMFLRDLFDECNIPTFVPASHAVVKWRFLSNGQITLQNGWSSAPDANVFGNLSNVLFHSKNEDHLFSLNALAWAPHYGARAKYTKIPLLAPKREEPKESSSAGLLNRVRVNLAGLNGPALRDVGRRFALNFSGVRPFRIVNRAWKSADGFGTRQSLVHRFQAFCTKRQTLFGDIDECGAFEGGFYMPGCPGTDVLHSFDLVRDFRNDCRGTSEYTGRSNIASWTMIALREAIRAFGLQTSNHHSIWGEKIGENDFWPDHFSTLALRFSGLEMSINKNDKKWMIEGEREYEFGSALECEMFLANQGHRVHKYNMSRNTVDPKATTVEALAVNPNSNGWRLRGDANPGLRFEYHAAFCAGRLFDPAADLHLLFPVGATGQKEKEGEGGIDVGAIKNVMAVYLELAEEARFIHDTTGLLLAKNNEYSSKIVTHDFLIPKGGVYDNESKILLSEADRAWFLDHGIGTALYLRRTTDRQPVALLVGPPPQERLSFSSNMAAAAHRAKQLLLDRKAAASATQQPNQHSANQHSGNEDDGGAQSDKDGKSAKKRKAGSSHRSARKKNKTEPAEPAGLDALLRALPVEAFVPTVLVANGGRTPWAHAGLQERGVLSLEGGVPIDSELERWRTSLLAPTL